jgi:hypothetical protein
MFILQKVRHSPESCPLGNSKNIEVLIHWLENIEKLTSAYNLTVVGAWADRPGHAIYAVFEAPSMEDFINFEVDPQNIPLLTFCHVEKRAVTSIKETLTFLKRRQITMQ